MEQLIITCISLKHPFKCLKLKSLGPKPNNEKCKEEGEVFWQNYNLLKIKFWMKALATNGTVTQKYLQEGSAALSWAQFCYLLGNKCNDLSFLSSFLPPIPSERGFSKWIAFFLPGDLRLSLSVKQIMTWLVRDKGARGGTACSMPQERSFAQMVVEVEHILPWTHIHLYLLSHVILK